MTPSVLTRQEFADRLAQTTCSVDEPVVVLENGSPAHVWLSYSAYDSLQRQGRVLVGGFADERNLVDLFDHPAFDANVDDFEIPQLDLKLQGVDLGSCS